MLSEALRRFKNRTGLQIPAMSQTLQHFLFVSFKKDVSKSAVVAAIECDPSLLLSALSAAPAPLVHLKLWHEQFSLPMLQALAITWAMSPTDVKSQASQENDAWQLALKRSLLAAALARMTSGVDPTEARLTALLAKGGGWFEEAGLLARDDVAPMQLFLEDLGCSKQVMDALQYDLAPLDQLFGTYPLIQVNAISRQLLVHLDSSKPLKPAVQSAIESLVGIAPEPLNCLVVEAADTFAQRCREICQVATADAEEPGRLITHSLLGSVFYRALLAPDPDMTFTQLITEVARLMVGARAVCHFQVEGSSLVTTLDGAMVRIDPDTPDSVIAKCFRGGEILLSSRRNASLLVEHQLLDWLGESQMVCLPLGEMAGVLVLGIADLDIGRDEILLDSLVATAKGVYTHLEKTGPKIDIAQVNRKAREITHEVNNPLAIMQNYLRTLAIKLGEGSLVQMEIDAMSRELKRIAGIVQKYAGIGDPLSLVYREGNLNCLVRDLVLLVQGTDRSVNVEMQLDDTIPDMPLAEDAIKQVLLNILKNAMEAVTEQVAPEIAVTTEGAVNLDGRPYMEITISDNGPGMSQTQRLELFNSSFSSKGEDRGMGLHIVRELLAEMSGMISCRTSSAGGASFHVLLPVGQAMKA